MPITAGLIVAGTGALIKTGIGFFGAKAAARDQKKNFRPNYAIPREWYDNRNIAASAAQNGLSQAGMNYYTGQAQRGLSSGLGTILQGGGNVNSVADLYDSYDTGINRITAEDDQLKNAKLASFINANSNLGNEEEKRWTLNQYQPYLDRSKKNAGDKAAGQQNMMSGIQDMGNALTSYSNVQNSISDKVPADRGMDSLSVAGNGGAPTVTGNISASPTSLSGGNIFSTPGGSAALQQIISGNRNSPYIQSLIPLLTNSNN